MNQLKSNELHVAINDPYQLLDKENSQSADCLRQALDPSVIHSQLQQIPLLKHFEMPRLSAIRVLRYKPGRRCLIDYQFSDMLHNSLHLIGKVRIKGFDKTSYSINQTLWRNGFSGAGDDQIQIPEPTGAIPSCNLWLQRKIEGEPLLPLLSGKHGEYWGHRVADAAYKLHCTDIPLHRAHSINDELQILHKRLAMVSHLEPDWGFRLSNVLASCYNLASTLPKVKPRGIHRDYYQDQFIADGNALYLLDLDLYCAGDPALDIGNFVAHTMEVSLRERDDHTALKAVEEALITRFLQLNPNATRMTVESYITLSLARHIYISTQFSDRKAYTPRLLDLCEQRLGLRQSQAVFL